VEETGRRLIILCGRESIKIVKDFKVIPVIWWYKFIGNEVKEFIKKAKEKAVEFCVKYKRDLEKNGNLSYEYSKRYCW
jgi:hypothetical protein